MALDICIQNMAGMAMGQVVALRVSADAVAIHRCRIDVYQDTLYAFSDRQLYRDCYITGMMNFTCGEAAVVFQYY
ncbi:putative pectinesterase 56 [Cardamine amara subsp. amara]|uniref:Pectinesterase 56 n=1 Tax=Cardamine amara subsp. amara TaxID=228776 RepID=A0ABD1BIC7_CARAN